jgi:hypothetical protein
VVRGLAETLFSPNGEVEPARLDAFIDEVDAFMSPASKTLRFGLCLMLDVIRLAPLFVIRRWSTFEALSLSDRTRMLEAMDRSRVAELTLIVVAYKTLMSILFFEAESELLAIGYPGPERHRHELGRDENARRGKRVVSLATALPQEEKSHEEAKRGRFAR